MRLTISDLACVRGERRIFDGLSFVLNAGDAAVVIGPNGAGKTSLLRLIAGFLMPAGGNVALDGAGGNIPEAYHFAGHFDAIKSALTVSENLDFGRAILGGGGASNEIALSRLGLGSIADFPAQTLSAGQRRRLALARLLVAPRPIWLLDEPTASLDTAGQEALTSMMSEHRSRGGIVIAATHMSIDLEDAKSVSLGSAE